MEARSGTNELVTNLSARPPRPPPLRGALFFYSLGFLGYGNAKAISSAGTPRAPMATTMYWRSSTM